MKWVPREREYALVSYQLAATVLVLVTPKSWPAMASGIETIERASRFGPRSSTTALPPRAGLALSHPARELVHVEIVPPGVDLAAADLENAHNRQLERLVGELEDVHPLRHHDRTIGCDVDDAEIDALDAWRARAQDRSDRVGDVLPAGDRRLRDVVVNGVLGEECGQLGCSHVVGPRGAKPAHHLDRAFHLAPPMRCCQFGEASVVGAAPLGSGCGWRCPARGGAAGRAWPAGPVARTRISATARIRIAKATPAATRKARSNPVASAWR